MQDAPRRAITASRFNWENKASTWRREQPQAFQLCFSLAAACVLGAQTLQAALGGGGHEQAQGAALR